MTHILFLLALSALLFLSVAAHAAADPIRLHPDNPHYFLFRGKPTVLVTSGEHYGAVLNRDFDYAKYLDVLHADGLNNTRTFVGAYCEQPGAFKIAQNTLAPAEGRFLCPWARSQTPGYANGGNKFDLTQWDAVYFTRLGDFVSKAADRGVVVEVNLFCPFYEDGMWNLSPMNTRNNVNGVGDVPREHVYTLDKHGGLLPVQDAMVRKVVTELKDFDNVYYEIMNEPYIRGVTLEWQHHIADVIGETEKQLGVTHLISQNIANGKAKVEHPHPGVSIFNFHYAWPPETVALNYGLGKVIGDNETGFKGTGDFHYRREGWAFLLAGGGLYNNLDYSFTVGHEDGTFQYPPTQPGGGTAALRRQLQILSEFFHRLNFVRMTPTNAVLKAGLPADTHAWALAETGRQYALYVCREKAVDPAASVELAVALPAGAFRAEWVNTQTGAVDRTEEFEHPGGERTLASPAFAEDVALRVLAAH
jgi:hypothetical protein